MDCARIRDNLAYQTPLFQETFLDDYISDMVNAPYIGRHQTEVWDYETDTIFYDKIHVMQPNYLTDWQVIDASECSDDSPCCPPAACIGFGTTRDHAFLEQLKLRSQLFCLEKLARIPKIGKQMAKIYKVVRNIPIGFTGDFIRARTVSYHDRLQICGANFASLAITTGNTATTLSTIDVGAVANLPTSELTWQYLMYQSTVLGMRGYDQDSGLSKGMRNIIVHPRTWQKLVGQNPEIKSQLHLVGVKDVSPLYELGTGINADPFGPYAPTFDEQQARFQLRSATVLERVLPYLNTPATTGERPIENPSYVDAKYAISVITHPKASKVYTTKPKKIHEMIPEVNSAMYGSWAFVNPQETNFRWENPSTGLDTTVNNEAQTWFYWLCVLQLGFEYDQRDLVMPILHLIDGSGKCCMVDSPVCCDPQYVNQDQYDFCPEECTELTALQER